jgi:endonuclease YncB( thermonuclease family)
MVKSIQLFCVVCFTILITATLSSAVELKISGRVTDVVDGDRLTVTNLNNRSQFTVRLLGIDAPEHDQPVGRLAREHLALLAMGQIVTISVTGFDGEGLVSSRVFLGDRDLGEQMVRDGAAWVDTQANALDPDTLRAYQDSERLAQKEHRGIWEEASPTPPWVHIKQMAESARNKEISRPQDHAAATLLETEPPRQATLQRESATTPAALPAPDRATDQKIKETVKKANSKAEASLIAKDASVPPGFIVIAWTATGKVVKKVAPIKGYDIMCDGSPLPRNYSIVKQTNMLHCARAEANSLNNAFLIKLDEAPKPETDATGCVREQGTHRVLEGFPEVSRPGEPSFGMTPKQVVACYGRIPTDAHRTITANGEVYVLAFGSGARFTFINGSLTKKEY